LQDAAQGAGERSDRGLGFDRVQQRAGRPRNPHYRLPNSTGKQVINGSAFTPSSFYPYTLDAAADVPASLAKHAGPQTNIDNDH